MFAALEFLYWTAILLGAAGLCLYVTWLFLVRFQQGKRGAKSFLRWLRDLSDAVFGLG